MNANRRQFLRGLAAAGSAAIVGARPSFAWQSDAAGGKLPPRGGKRLLILGGTMFLGPAVVEAARERGYVMTLFNRGKTNPQLFPDVEKLHGNRDGDLKSLEGRRWDVVIDTSGYVPRVVRDSATLLSAARQYVFISTMSVYSDNSKPGADETAPVGKLDDETTEKITGESYGPLKALCERAAEDAMPGRVTVVRPGLIVGPRDPSDRFTYWPVRVKRGGEVLAPGTPDDPVQFIDVRDLAAFVLTLIENRTMGVFNATGPDKTLTIGTLLDTCKSTTRSDARFTWCDAEFLAEQKVSPWGDMPVWVPPAGESAGFARSNVSKAVKAGLRFTPLTETVRDTLAWFETLPADRQAKLKAGIAPDREKEVLSAWSKRNNKS